MINDDRKEKEMHNMLFQGNMQPGVSVPQTMPSMGQQVSVVELIHLVGELLDSEFARHSKPSYIMCTLVVCFFTEKMCIVVTISSSSHLSFTKICKLVTSS